MDDNRKSFTQIDLSKPEHVIVIFKDGKKITATTGLIESAINKHLKDFDFTEIQPPIKSTN